MNKISLKKKFIYGYISLGLSAIAIVLAICLTYINLDGKLVSEIYSDPLYVYSTLLFLLSLILASIIIYKSKTFPPSIVLFLFFLAVPLIGSISYGIFIKYHEWAHLEFAFPTFVWAIGTVTLLAGILFSYFVIPIPKCSYVIKWDLKRGSFLLWFTVVVSLFFTVLTLIKIGYMPVLTSDINRERVFYSQIAGEWTVKFSRLFILAASMASMFTFLKRQRKIYLFIVLLSGLTLFIYGQRLYPFLAFVSFLLIGFKFYKPKLSRIIILIIVGICMTSFLAYYHEFRAGRSTKGYKLQDVIITNIFAEWREYSYVVNQIRGSDDYYKEKIFLGALVCGLPKQIWSALGVDKNYIIHKYGASWVFGEYFHQEEDLGIRIGTIGEAYAGYGIFYGVCLQMFLFGIIFGVLERIYLRLNNQDARLCPLCFLISLLLYLPLTTLFVTISLAHFFGFFFVLYHLIGTNQVTKWVRK